MGGRGQEHVCECVFHGHVTRRLYYGWVFLSFVTERHNVVTDFAGVGTFSIYISFLHRVNTHSICVFTHNVQRRENGMQSDSEEESEAGSDQGDEEEQQQVGSAVKLPFKRSTLMKKWNALPLKAKVGLGKVWGLDVLSQDLFEQLKHGIGAEKTKAINSIQNWETLRLEWEQFNSGTLSRRKMEMNQGLYLTLKCVEAYLQAEQEDVFLVYPDDVKNTLDLITGFVLNMDDDIEVYELVEECVHVVTAMDGLLSALEAEEEQEILDMQWAEQQVLDSVEILALVDEMVEDVETGKVDFEVDPNEDYSLNMDLFKTYGKKKKKSKKKKKKKRHVMFNDEIEVRLYEVEDEEYYHKTLKKAGEKGSRDKFVRQADLPAEDAESADEGGAETSAEDLAQGLKLPGSFEHGGDSDSEDDYIPKPRIKYNSTLILQNDSDKIPACDLFPEHFERMPTIEPSLMISDFSTFNESSMYSEADEVDMSSRLSVDEAGGSDEEVDENGAIMQTMRELLESLNIAEIYAEGFEEQEVTVKDLIEDEDAKALVKKIVTDSDSQKRMLQWLTKKQKETDKRLQAAKKAAQAMNKIDVPDTIHELFVALKIPSRLGDYWESQGRAMSDLTSMSKSEYKKLMPQRGPRARLMRFVKNHRSELKKKRSHFKEVEQEKEIFTKVMNPQDYLQWLEDKNAKEELAEEERAAQGQVTYFFEDEDIRIRTEESDQEIDITAEAEALLHEKMGGAITRTDTMDRVLDRGGHSTEEIMVITKSNKKTKDKFNPYIADLETYQREDSFADDQNAKPKPMPKRDDREKLKANARMCGCSDGGDCIIS